jgi:hypothetical protein
VRKGDELPTSKRVKSLAGKVLESPRSTKAARSVAGSLLEQAKKKPPANKKKR